MPRWACLAMEVEPAEGGLTEARADALADGVARWLNAELPGRVAHHYAPQGLSLVRHGPGCRLALHTWPEWRVATLDVWAPRERLDRWQDLTEWLAAEARCRVLEVRLHEAPRGALAVAD